MPARISSPPSRLADVMRVLVTRPEPDATSQAERLAARGHEPVLAPLLAIESATDVPLELDGAQALIVTSRNALRALASHRDLATALQLPLFAVGEATAKAATELGFTTVTAGPGTGEELSRADRRRALAKCRGARASCRRNRRLRLEIGAASQRLHAAAARPLPGCCGDEAARRSVLSLLNASKLDGVILMSPRTAAIFAALVVRHGALTQASRLDCYCLSAAVAQAVEPLKARAIVAVRPYEDDILALLDSDAASS